MQDAYSDGWDGARYRLRDFETTEIVAVGTLNSGAEGTDSLCLDGAVCYTLEVTSGQYPSEISWSFGDLAGGAPYGPTAIWVESGAIATGGTSCPTPAPTVTHIPSLAPTSTAAPSATPLPTPSPTAAPTHNPTTTRVCFDLIMQDSLYDGWNGARYQLSVTATSDIVQTGTLIAGDLGTDVLCLLETTCYTFQVASGASSFQDYDYEISWNLNGTISGGAPYEPVEVWVDNGDLETGICPTPAPTISPTSLTAAPSTTPAPSPIPTTPIPTAMPTPIATYEVGTFQELESAVQLSQVLVNVTAPLIVMPAEIVISGDVTIFSAGGDATLLASSSRHFYVSSGSRLQLEGLALLNGRTDHDGGGGSVAATAGAHLELMSCAFKNCTAKDRSGHSSPLVWGGTLSLWGATANIENCSFIMSTVQSYYDPHGGALSLMYSSTASVRKCRFEQSTMIALYYGYGGTVSVTEDSSASFEDCQFERSAAISKHYDFGGQGGTAYVGDSSTCAFIRCSFSDSFGTRWRFACLKFTCHA